MQWLADLLTALWASFLDAANSMFKYARESVSWFWATCVCAAAAGLHSILAVFSDLIDTARSAIESVVLPSFGLPPIASQVYGLSDTFCPLTEAIAWMSVYLAFIGLLTGYRIVKSWIPTLS